MFNPLEIYTQVDDAVGATCVHGFGGIWGLIAIGLFAQKDELSDVGYSMCVRLQHTGDSLYVIPNIAGMTA